MQKSSQKPKNTSTQKPKIIKIEGEENMYRIEGEPQDILKYLVDLHFKKRSIKDDFPEQEKMSWPEME